VAIQERDSTIYSAIYSEMSLEEGILLEDDKDPIEDLIFNIP